ncbi:1697_t:CDS:2, partial [Racocetra fulgida]
ESVKLNKTKKKPRNSNQKKTKIKTMAGISKLFCWEWAVEAFPANAKFGKKGGGKRIRTEVINILKQLFLNGNLNPKDKMTAKEMREELLRFVRAGEIEEHHVPQLNTIQSWIGRYAKEFNREETAIVLETFKEMGSSSL